MKRVLFKMHKELAETFVKSLFDSFAQSPLSGSINDIEDFSDEQLKVKQNHLNFLRHLASSYFLIKTAPASSHFEFIEVMDED